MVWANFKVEPETLALLPRYAGDELPSEVVKSRLRNVYSLDGCKFRRGERLGAGASGVCHTLSNEDGSVTWVLKRYRPQRLVDLRDDLVVAECGLMLPMRAVSDEEAIMPCGLCLLALVQEHPIQYREVEALIGGIMRLQRDLMTRHNALYTDLKLDNVLLFRSPDVDGQAAVMFCDHGGCTLCGTRGVATYPPPGENVSGQLGVTLGFARDEWTWAIYWCGLLVAALYDLLEPRYAMFAGRPDVTPEQRVEYNRSLQQLLWERHLGKFSPWIDLDPYIRECAAGPPSDW